MSSNAFVYINNEKVELMEDRRLNVFAKFPPHHFPDSPIVIMDPSYYPPRAVPMSTLDDEQGVTARKLLPHAHYHAFRVDQNGERHTVNIQPRYLVVHNLPQGATAEQVGKYFEQFDYIVEGDIIKPPGQPGQCKGRGYVQFQNPDTAREVLMQYRTLPIAPNVQVWLDMADTKPRGSTAAPPPQYHNTTIVTSGGGSAGGAMSAASNNSLVATGSSHHPSHASGSGSGGSGSHHGGPNSFVDTRITSSDASASRHHHHHHSAGSSILPAPAPPAAVATCTHNFYFITHMYEEHIQTSVRDGIFWPTKVNQRTFYTALARGPVYLLFLLMNRPTLFGYARVTHRDMARNKHANFTLEWVKHGVFLTEKELNKAFPSVNVLSITDGTSLKPELGQAICEFVDTQPKRSQIPPEVPTLSPSMSHNASTNSLSASSSTNTINGQGSSSRAAPTTPNATSTSPTSGGAPSSSSFVPQPRSAQSPTSAGSPTLPRPQSLSSVNSPSHHHVHHHHLHHHHHHHSSASSPSMNNVRGSGTPLASAGGRVGAVPPSPLAPNTPPHHGPGQGSSSNPSSPHMPHHHHHHHHHVLHHHHHMHHNPMGMAPAPLRGGR